MSTFLRSNTCSMDWAELSEMLYPSRTYLVAATSQASHRCEKAALTDSMWGR